MHCEEMRIDLLVSTWFTPADTPENSSSGAPNCPLVLRPQQTASLPADVGVTPHTKASPDEILTKSFEPGGEPSSPITPQHSVSPVESKAHTW